MNVYVADLWERAKKALVVAESIRSIDSDAAASRAYYAAFYAASAHFALAGQTFIKHSAVTAAVHRDLVKTGLWSKALGKRYSWLHDLRYTSDYGGTQHATPEQAELAVQAAAEILRAVAQGNPEMFTDLKEL